MSPPQAQNRGLAFDLRHFSQVPGAWYVLPSGASRGWGVMRVLIDRYIGRLILWPLVVTLAVSAMLLLIVRMVDLTALLIDQGGTFITLLHVLSELVPQYLALGIPVGLLMGVLLAFRQLT